ncbi:MAG: Rrf2 family transcriptional regulator [Actinobacteria bacterium]|nr:Rrf2 family transcriptional regulator [Actinomycetota bacterium]MBM3712512.1 Rrf2 family transcriptional regulator [Actinomycetota bacterium]
MKLITRETDYAIRALGYIAKNDGRIISITEIVKELDQPRPFLRKLLQILNQKGILKSFRGKDGGFKLALKPEDITLVGIMEIFQGKFKLKDCLLKKKICPNKPTCLLKAKLDKIERYVEEELRTTTLKSII